VGGMGQGHMESLRFGGLDAWGGGLVALPVAPKQKKYTYDYPHLRATQSGFCTLGVTQRKLCSLEVPHSESILGILHTYRGCTVNEADP
jgi:hypothetical protein